jgi:4-amino-4-deoxy-L-arabinose transferase-like glycosyltransferase
MPNYLKYILITLGAMLLFFPFLGQAHLFDWDEINFAECAREMIVTKDYLRAQIDFMPFWEKPPVFIWMQVLAMKLFGVGAYAARFPNAVMGIITLCTIYYAGKKIVNEKMATWWVVLYAATWLPHFYFKSGIIDPTFNYFIFLAFFQLHLLKFSGGKVLHAVLAGLFLGMAVLTKGPAAIIVAALSLVVYYFVSRGQTGVKAKHLLFIALCAAVPFLLWMGIAMANYGFAYGKWFLTEFISYQVRLFTTEDSDHGGPFFYHFVVLLIGCFPATAFLFQYTRKRSEDSIPARDFTKLMWVMFWVVLILFSIVKTKIVHYSSLCYFPLTFLAALQVYRLSYSHLRIKKLVQVVLAITGAIFAILITALPIVGINKEKLIPYIDDKFAVGNLQANVQWGYAECLWGLGYLIAILIAIVAMKKDFRKAIVALCIIQLVMIQVTILHFTPKIEAYSQRAAINFYKKYESQEVYIWALGYKSYAYLFYAQKPNFANAQYYKNGKVNEAWLLDGVVDKPTYFVCKIPDAKQYLAHPRLEKLYEENGFVFFKRK